ncbi:hypothetical protein D3C80_436950 [compost metagenome]
MNKDRFKRSSNPDHWGASALFVGSFFLAVFAVGVSFAQTEQPVAIPLLHVPSNDDPTDFDALGIMIGINWEAARLYQFDTGSDMFVGQMGQNLPKLTAEADSKPSFYPYSDGTYGYWMQKIHFQRVSYFQPDRPSNPVVVISGDFVGGNIIDWVLTKQHPNFKSKQTTSKPVGHDEDGTPLYADLNVRKRIENDQPSDHPPFYGTFGTGDFVEKSGASAALGTQTETGYVISANANIGHEATPGCAPCLTLNLTPNIRSQFTALVPWGKLDYEFSQRKFFGSSANASTEEEGNFNYAISFSVGKKKRAVSFQTKILFDTGSPNFVFIDDSSVLSKLRNNGFKLAAYDVDLIDFKFTGFHDKQSHFEYEDVIAERDADETEGSGVTLGIPFFQQNAVMYDLENRTTAISPYFVTAEEFTTDSSVKSMNYLGKVTSRAGSSGWLGLAGIISGAGDVVIENGANVRMTNTNSYTGLTSIAAKSNLHLAGSGSIEHSSQIRIDGSLYIDQKGQHLASWNVPAGMSDTHLRDIIGKGDIFLGSNKLVLTNADSVFEGRISDYNDEGKNTGGGIVLRAGKLTIAGKADYSGVAEVASGAELHITGELRGNVSVKGKLTIDGKVNGTVEVASGGSVSGAGNIGNLVILEGGENARTLTTATE